MFSMTPWVSANASARCMGEGVMGPVTKLQTFLVMTCLAVGSLLLVPPTGADSG